MIASWRLRGTIPVPIPIPIPTPSGTTLAIRQPGAGPEASNEVSCSLHIDVHRCNPRHKPALRWRDSTFGGGVGIGIGIERQSHEI